MKIILLLSFILLSACASDTGAYKKSHSITNDLAAKPPAPWSEMNSEGSDFALHNKKTKSIFLFNSACRKYESSNLNTLTSSILTGLDEVVILEKKTVEYQERQAAVVSATGKLDGILRFIKIITIQKNNCIYDYVLIATNKANFENDSVDLETFLHRIILN